MSNVSIIGHPLVGLFLSLLALAPTRAQTPAQPLTLIDQGQALAVIITPADAPKAHAAALELQTHLQQMTDVLLPLVTEGQSVEAAAVQLHVGATAVVRQLLPDRPAGYDPTPRPEAFEEEGFVLRTVGRQVLIVGNDDGPYRGTNDAVCRLLEKLGVRWYFPGEWGTIIPRQTTVTTPALDLRVKPDFPVRHTMLSGWVPTSREEYALYDLWAQRIGMTDGDPYPLVGDGFLATLVHPQEYFRQHPEWFALNEKGVREAYEHSPNVYYDRYTMLCLSNEEMFAQAVRNLNLAFAGQKDMNTVKPHGVGISPPDGTPYCYCDACRAHSANFKYPRYVHRTTDSEEFFGFAAKLARTIPGKWVSTMAYSLREIVPQGVALPGNVMVKIAPISCDVKHPNDSPLWRRRDFMRNLRAWRAMTPHVTIYDYNPGMLTGMWLPERDVANSAINVPMYRDLGIKGFTREGRKAFMQTWISYYIFTKLLWDADADVAALQRDFYDTFFGPAAGPHVQAWWDAHERLLLDDPMQAHEDFVINHIYTPAFAQSLQPHVEAARQAPMTDAQRRRLDAFVLIDAHFQAYTRMNAAEQAMDYAAAARHAGEMVELKNRLHQLYSFFIEVPAGKPRMYFAEGRQQLFEQQHARTAGAEGELVASLPLEMAFARDPYNEGIIAGWHQPEFDSRGWDTRNTFFTWDQQETPQTEAGHDWDGIGWYRATFTVDPRFTGRTFRFWCGGTMNESWVWINGQYVGHQEHKLWWAHPHEFELDVTAALKPGAENTIAIRVLNDAEIGGLFRRGFIWAPR